MPKLKLAGFDPRVPAVTPVPDRAIVSVGLEAFELTVTVPVAAAAVVGANVTLKLALWPAAKVTGAVIPLRVNPVPVMLTWDIVTLDPPVLVTVSERDLLVPTVTLPKARLVGFDARVPAVTPVPDRAIVSVGLEAFEVIVILPLALAAVVGANATVKVALWPAVKVTGAAIPLRVNPVPVMLT